MLLKNDHERLFMFEYGEVQCRVLSLSHSSILYILYNCRDVYVSTMQPHSKHVVIMMDHGNSLSATQMLMARSIAKNLIAAFTENDRVNNILLFIQLQFSG